MAYDTTLADRARAALAERTEFTEQPMFGGLCFMVNTHMACGMVRDGLLVRVGTDRHDEALSRGAEVMQMGSRQMRGVVLVPAADLSSDDELDRWLDWAVAIAQSEPPKPPKPPKPKAADRTG